MYKQISNLTIGLDPIMKCSLKLQIKDIQNLEFDSSEIQLTPSAGVAGETEGKLADDNQQALSSDVQSTACNSTGIMHLKGSHRVVNRVEVMGIVVRVDKRDRRQSYAVDDGTGVITCTFWKNKRTESQMMPDLDLPQSLREKLVNLWSDRESASEGYDIGDLILVRGRITEFREQKEIDVLDHCKMDNPNYEYERILGLSALYAEYKKPFTLPENVRQQFQIPEAKGDCIKSLQNSILNHLCESTSFHTFTVSDVMSWPGIRSELFSQQSSNIDDESKHAATVKLALQVIEKSTGKVCQLADGTQRFQLVKPDSPVGLEAIAILKSACASGVYSEIGCHFQHINERLRRTSPYDYVGMTAMKHLIDQLEESGDLIALGNQRYLPVS